MRLLFSMAGVTDWIRRKVEWLFSGDDTARFLRERNARLTVQEAGSRSFYGLKVSPETLITSSKGKLRLRLRLGSNQTLRVTVQNQTTHQTLVDATVPFTSSAGTMNLDLDGVHLKMEVDDDPALHVTR